MFPNLDAFIRRFDTETFWVATEICSEADHRRRVLVTEAFIRIAMRCRDANNMFSMCAIVGGLNVAPVRRFKRMWGEVGGKLVDGLREMEGVMSPYQNMKAYRERIAGVVSPIVPALRTRGKRKGGSKCIYVCL